MKAPKGFRGAFRTDEGARALYSEGAGIFRILPAAVAVPSDLNDLVALVAWAGATGTPLVPRGAGSGMPGGNVGPGVVVDLRFGFREPPTLDVARRTARAGAGVTFSGLDQAARRHGLFLPPDPSSGKFCTVGGMVATNAAGAHTVKYGPMREWVSELAFVTGEGELARAGMGDLRLENARTKAERRLLEDVAPLMRMHQLPLETAGPKTRKNSSGYRLANNTDNGWVRHLLIGSEGTLGIVTEVEVRLAPVPDRATTALATLRSLDDLAPLVSAIAAFRPSSVELLDRTYLDFVREKHPAVPVDAEAVVLVELEGDATMPAIAALRRIAADVQTADDESRARGLWELRHLASPILAGLPETTRSLQVVEDGCVPLPRLGDYIRGLRRIAGACGFRIVIFGHAGDAHVHANVLADVSQADLAERLSRCLEEVTALQLELGGTPSGEHGDGRLRAPFLEKLFGKVYVEVCRRVKQAMDPKGILNPGVKLPTAHGAPLTADQLKVGVSAPTLPDPIAALLRDIEKNARYGEDRLALLPSTSNP